MKEFYTVRKNAACRAVLSKMKAGTMRRWLTLTDIGRVDGEVVTGGRVPDWMLSRETRDAIARGLAGRAGVKPDIVVLEGWPENMPHPTQPTTRLEVGGGRQARIKLHVVEVGFSSDLYYEEKAKEKRTK